MWTSCEPRSYRALPHMACRACLSVNRELRILIVDIPGGAISAEDELVVTAIRPP